MRKKSVLPVKYEKEAKESSLSAFGGATIFLEFIRGFGFDRISDGLRIRLKIPAKII